MANTDDVSFLTQNKVGNQREGATTSDLPGARSAREAPEKSTTIHLQSEQRPSVNSDTPDQLPDLNIKDYQELVRLSTAMMGCFDFSDPIPADLPSAEFVKTIYNSRSAFIEGSIAFTQTAGYQNVEDALGMHLTTFFPAARGYENLFLQWREKQLSRGSFEVSVTTPHGNQNVLQVVAYATLIDRSIHRIWFVIRDVTAHAQSLATLAQAERHYRALVERPGLILGRILLNETAEYWSPSLEELTGIPIQEIKNCPSLLVQFVHPEDLHKIDQLYAARSAGTLTQINTEMRMRSSNGEYHTFYVRQSPMISSRGNVEFYDLLAIDVQSHKELELELQRNAQVALVGQLAAGISHDFNNYLTAILGQIDGALALTEQSTPSYNALLAARRGAESCSQMTTQLLTIGRRSAGSPADVDLNEIIHEVCTLVSRVIPNNITLRVSTCSSPLITKGERVQLQQVVINLILNARDSMPSGGTLTVSVTPAAPGAPIVSNHDTPSSSIPIAACVSVRDTGCGIPKEALGQVFRPFYSTKSIKGGTGLGLSMVKMIVEAHSGWIDLSSEEGEGTVFSVYLPVQTQEKDRNDAALLAASQYSTHIARSTIVLAEDDDMIRNMLSTAFSSMGCSISPFQNGILLVKYLEEHTAPCDLIILDDGMPKARGVELLEQVRALQPEATIVLTSGDPAVADDPSLQKFRVTFLAKPFALTELLRLLAEKYSI